MARLSTRFRFFFFNVFFAFRTRPFAFTGAPLHFRNDVHKTFVAKKKRRKTPLTAAEHEKRFNPAKTPHSRDVTSRSGSFCIIITVIFSPFCCRPPESHATAIDRWWNTPDFRILTIYCYLDNILSINGPTTRTSLRRTHINAGDRCTDFPAIPWYAAIRIWLRVATQKFQAEPECVKLAIIYLSFVSLYRPNCTTE